MNYDIVYFTAILLVSKGEKMTNIFTGLKKNTIDLRNNVSKVNNELKRQQDNNKRYKYCMSNTNNIITFSNNNLQIIEDGALVLERKLENGIDNTLHNYFSKQLLTNKVINRYSLFLLENNQYIEYMNLKKGDELKSGIIVSDDKRVLDFIIGQLTCIYGYDYDNNLQYLLSNVLTRK